VSTPADTLDDLVVPSSSVAPSGLYGRKLSIILANNQGTGLDFSKFRVVFNIMRGDNQTPNSADIRIYNVSQATVIKVLSEFTQVSLSAGYVNANYGLLFQGYVKQYRVGRVDQKDSYIDITAADGDQAYNFAPVFLSLKSGTTQGGIAEALKSALAAKGIATEYGYIPPLPTNPIIRGKVMFGMARDETRTFAHTNDIKWSIQDGALTFIPTTSYIPATVVTLSPSTGLIGVPEQTQQGINIRSLINVNLKIGQLVRLVSSDINQLRLGLDKESQAVTNPSIALQASPSSNGLYYIMVANHSGDTRGNPWYTDMVCLAVDATLAPGQLPSSLSNPILAY